MPSSIIQIADQIRVEMSSTSDQERRSLLGQFLTPAPLARFIAKEFPKTTRPIRLLDPGAGVGILTAAVVEQILSWDIRPPSVEIIACELDEQLHEHLSKVLNACVVVLRGKGIDTRFEIYGGDFVEMATHSLDHTFFDSGSFGGTFSHAIINPPYRKINADSSTRKLLSEIGLETTNLYAAFVWLSSRLLDNGGYLSAITPRSFCNGPYFRSFRKAMNSSMSWERLHIFDERNAAFSDDSVLQENIIFQCRKGVQSMNVIVSSGSGADCGTVSCRSVPFSDVVSPSDPQGFIHLTVDNSAVVTRQLMSRFSTSLTDLGLSVSTGRVVDFRSKDYLRHSPTLDGVPLIYPHHLNGSCAHWPGKPNKKPDSILIAEETRNLLIPSGIYVLVKRFSSKEERRRIVASLFDPQILQRELTVIGFENHLNYFHSNGLPLNEQLARGLFVYLNSTLVDSYFRQFNGHTQVNATDLRSMMYPNRKQLVDLAKAYIHPTQEHYDEALSKILDSSISPRTVRKDRRLRQKPAFA